MKNLFSIFLVIFLLFTLLTACGQVNQDRSVPDCSTQEEVKADSQDMIILGSEIMELENGFRAVKFEGNDGFEDFLLQGGASSDEEVAGFLMDHLLPGADLGLFGESFGCSTIAVSSPDGEHLFGSNFDWDHCEAMVVLRWGMASMALEEAPFIWISIHC